MDDFISSYHFPKNMTRVKHLSTYGNYLSKILTIKNETFLHVVYSVDNFFLKLMPHCKLFTY